MDYNLNYLDNKKEISYLVILFLISPFISLLLSFYYFKSQWSKNIFWFYSAFAGYTFVISSSEYDASRMRDSLKLMQVPAYKFSDIFFGNDGQVNLDFVEAIITYTVSLFTGDYRMLFAILGLFMGYFLTRVIWFVVKCDVSAEKYNLVTSLTMAALILVIGIWDIGGLRWNSAALIFILGTFVFVIEKKAIGLILVFFSVFVHWAFLLALVLFIFYILIRDKVWVYYIVFIISFLFVELDLNLFYDFFMNYAPSSLIETRQGYFDDSYLESLKYQRMDLSWYILIYKGVLKWFIFAIVSYVVAVDLKRVKSNKVLNNLLCMGMLFYGVTNLMSVVPSMNRFLTIGNIYILSFMFLYFRWNKAEEKHYMLFKYFAIPVLLLFIIVRLRIGCDFLGIWSIVGSPFFVYFVDNKVALIDLVKYVF